MRFSLTFALLSLASLVLGASNDVTPSQVHLAYHGFSGMTVSWSTHSGLSKPTVKYGLTPQLLIFQASSSDSVTYPTSSVYINHVILSNLLPSVKYYYSVSNSNTVYSFTTARIAGDPRPYTAAVAIDMGAFGPLGQSDYTPLPNKLAPGEITTPQRLAMDMSKYDHILHPGDLAYADYWLKEEVQKYLPFDLSTAAATYEAINEEFYDNLAPFAPYRPYMVGPGNHEANCDNNGYKTYTSQICMVGQTNFTGYINRFRMPSDVSGGVGNFWYSFDYGMTHYVFYNTETDLGTGLAAQDNAGGNTNALAGPFGAPNEQIEFLKKDLAKVDRLRTPWVVAMGHRPYYVASSKCTSCQQAFEDIFYQGGVDLVMTGHVHASERNHPIYKNVIDPALLNNPRAPWYVTNGAAGHYDGLDTLDNPYPNYVAFANNTLYSYSRLTFNNRTHLTHDFVSAATGQVFDSATLYKKH